MPDKARTRQPAELAHALHSGALTNHQLEELLPLAQQALDPPRLKLRGQRTLDPAADAIARLGLDVTTLGYPTITVVGSKGKGTATLAASAALHAAGLRVGTVTSPSFVQRTERIRVAGTALSAGEYVACAAHVQHAMTDTITVNPNWVVPHLGGMHFLAALHHFHTAHLDAAVFEASMGGRQDEVSLLPSQVVIVTELFEEHLGILGDNVYEIATEKLGAVTSATRVVITVEQSEQALAAFEDTGVNARTRVVVVKRGSYGHHRNPIIDRNVELGRVAAQELLTLTGRTDTPAVPDGLSLPGRCSTVADRAMVDCAVNAAGVRAALEEYRAQYGHLPTVALTCFPTSKDDQGCLDALAEAGVPVVGVDLPALREHLRPNRDMYAPWPVVDIEDMDLPDGNWLALGTVSFIAAVLTRSGANLTQLW